MELGLRSSFEKTASRKIEKEDKPKEIWERITEDALAIVTQKRDLKNNPEALRRIEEKINNPIYKKTKMAEWDRRVLNNSAETDPEKEDERLTDGMVIDFVDMIDN
jgi:hypothetical protein